jgi:hypothetical protein
MSPDRDADSARARPGAAGSWKLLSRGGHHQWGSEVPVHTAATKSVEMHGPEVADKGMERYLSIPLSDGPEAAAACSHIEHSRQRSTNTV